MHDDISTLFPESQDDYRDDIATRIKEFIGDTPSRDLEYLIDVGYFSLSGFFELYPWLKDSKIKILVGMKFMRHNMGQSEDPPSGEEELTDKYFTKDLEGPVDDIAKAFEKQTIFEINHFDVCNTSDKKSMLQRFFYKLDDGSLELKQHFIHSHSKIMIITNNKTNKKLLVVGSSNFTKSGLDEKIQRNTSEYFEVGFEGEKLIGDDVKIKKVRSRTSEFCSYWDDDRTTTRIERVEDIRFEQSVEAKSHGFNEPDPLDIYVRILKELNKHDVDENFKKPSELKSTFNDLKYQLDAIKKGLSIVEQHNGVLIADVVGLGKSIVASLIAYNLKQKYNSDSKHVVISIITPPTLRNQWENYSNLFRLDAKIESIGKLDNHKKMLDTIENYEHIVIIDEAHRFRNENVELYEKAKLICVGAKVILLSATPFNNSPSDLFSLIKLFQLPGASTIRSVDNLMNEFIHLIKTYKEVREKISKNSKNALLKSSEQNIDIKQRYASQLESINVKLKDILRPITIRRSRLDLERIDSYKKDLVSQGISFPKVNDPEILEYDLSAHLEMYKDTIPKLSINISDSKNTDEVDPDTFNGFRYNPTTYLTPTGRLKFGEDIGRDRVQQYEAAQNNVSKHLRRLLVRRFESSVYSFEKSLNNFINSYRHILKIIEDYGVIPISKKRSPEDILNLLYDQTTDLRINRLVNEGDDFEDMSSPDTEDFSDNVEESLSSDDESKYLDKYELTGQELAKSFRKTRESEDLELLPIGYLKSEYVGYLKNDLHILEELNKEWFEKSTIKKDDPKGKFIFKTLEQKLLEFPERKFIIFSEFADTVEGLYEYIQKQNSKSIKPFLYSSSLRTAERFDTLLSNFDAGLDDSDQSDDFNVLIATDVISEGYNLHRADSIFNYDIPYNPTRVIQRIGRINRINKKVFNELFIYNFFPTDHGEAETRTKEISTLKIQMFNEILGDDTKKLTSNEELKQFLAESFNETNILKDPSESEFDQIEREHINYWEQVKDNRSIMEKADAVPFKTKCLREANSKDLTGKVLFGRVGKEDFKFQVYNNETNSIQTIPHEQGLQYFQAKVGLKGQELEKVSDKDIEESFKLFSKKEAVHVIEQNNKGQSQSVLKALAELKKLGNLSRKQNKIVDDWIVCIRDLGGFSKYKLKEISKLIEEHPSDRNLYQLLKKEFFIEEEVSAMIRQANENKSQNQVVWFYEECEQR